MKRTLKVLLPIMAVLATALVFAACSDVSSISIAETDLPQTTFVQGNDLDLSKGTLTVKTDDGVDKIALNSDGVTVKGYDKNKLGDQSLVVEYEGQSTTFTVTVVPRLSAENYERNYFVGESFNPNKGRLRVYRDDGTSYTVPVKNDDVTVGEMDSSKAIQPVEVEIAYKPDENTRYSGKIEVNIYDVDSATMKSPSKISYKSHEESLDVAGGYITLKSDGGELTRTVVLSDPAVTVTGYDPAAATVANRDTELSQKITVTYSGREFSYNVGVKYSDVSLIHDYYDAVKDVVLEKDGFNLTVELGKKALDGATLYLQLSEADLTYITEDEANCIARVAAYYGGDVWYNEFKKYSKAFTLYNGALSLVCNSYSETKATYAALSADKDNVLFTVAGVLNELAEQFPDVVITENKEDSSKNVKLGDFLAIVVAPEDIEKMLDQFDYMIRLHDALDAVPENWKTTDAKLATAAYGAAVDKAISLIRSNSAEYSSRAVYMLLAGWREDYFDIIYTNCYYQKKPNSITVVKDFYLPGALEELYETLVICYNQIGVMSQAVSQSRYADSTTYMWYMREAEKKLDELSASEDEMISELFAGLTFKNFVSEEVTLSRLYSLIYGAQYGYVYHIGAMLGDARFSALWDKYLDIFGAYRSASDQSAYLKSSAFVTGATEMFNMFVDLTPSEQFHFIKSVNVNYNKGYPALAFEHAKGCYSYFAMFMVNGFIGALGDTEEMRALADAVLYAVENYARYTVTGIGQQTMMKLTAYNEFKKAMTTVESNKDVVNGKTELAKFYAKYTEILGIYKTEGSMIETEVTYTEDEQAKLDAFKGLYSDVLLAVAAMTQTSSSLNASGLLISAYEKWRVLEAELLSSGNDKLIQSYLYRAYTMTEGNSMALSYYMYYARTLYTNVTMSYSISNIPVYSMYAMAEDADSLRAFFVNTYNIASTALKNLLSSVSTGENKPELATYDQAEIDAAMDAYAKLNGVDRALYRLITTGLDLFGTGVLEHYKGILEGDAYNALSALLTVINADALYEFAKDTTSEQARKDALKTCYDDLKTKYNAVADKTAFDGHFKKIYDKYADKCEQLFATA